MQGYVNGNYEAVIPLVVRNGNNLKSIKPLVGMMMLKGYRLQIDAIEGGLVTIQNFLQ